MSRRTERIASLIQQAVGRILVQEMSDPRIVPGRTAVTRVEVPEDLLAAKVFVSVMGDQGEQERTILALNHASRRIQTLMRRQVSLRFTPALEFVTDQRYKGALKTWEIIRQAMEEIRQKEGQQEGQQEQSGVAESPPADMGAGQDRPDPTPGRLPKA